MLPIINSFFVVVLLVIQVPPLLNDERVSVILDFPLVTYRKKESFLLLKVMNNVCY